LLSEIAQPSGPLAIGERARLARRAKLLALAGNGYHLAELAVALAAGILASSPALYAFGGDTGIELFSGTVIACLFTGARVGSGEAELRAQRLIAFTFFALALFITVEALRSLLAGHQPDVSWLGIGLAAVTVPTMPLLARLKTRVGKQLHSTATMKEGRQNQICAYLAGALLLGLGSNALFGWWWADPTAALVIAGVAAYEGRETWRGRGCDCC
jgi:divalent metal cation (Fe/Co/Zn/Cd) transporter